MSSRARLFAIFAGRLACIRVDEMHRSARKAGDAYKDIAAPFGLIIVGCRALHMEARIWAAVDEWRHSSWVSFVRRLVLRDIKCRRNSEARRSVTAVLLTARSLACSFLACGGHRVNVLRRWR